MRVAALCATSEEILSRESPTQTANTARPSPPSRLETQIISGAWGYSTVSSRPSAPAQSSPRRPRRTKHLSESCNDKRNASQPPMAGVTDIQLLGQITPAADWPKLFAHWQKRNPGGVGAWPRRLDAGSYALNLWPVPPSAVARAVGIGGTRESANQSACCALQGSPPSLPARKPATRRPRGPSLRDMAR